MKKILICILLMSNIQIFAQGAKTYDYIIVPVKYEFTSEPNQFQLNVLTRILLKEEGFQVYMSEGEEMPKKLAENRCLALRANVIKDNSLFTSNLRFQLKDCFGKTVFESAGTSREKDFKDAYHEALRIAIKDFQSVSNRFLKSNGEDKTMDELPVETIDLPFEELANEYLSNGKSFWLLKQDQDYVLYEDKGENILATLKKADTGTYAYDSAEIDGAAYFDAEGNLIIEYLAKDKDAVKN